MKIPQIVIMIVLRPLTQNTGLANGVAHLYQNQHLPRHNTRLEQVQDTHQGQNLTTRLDPDLVTVIHLVHNAQKVYLEEAKIHCQQTPAMVITIAILDINIIPNDVITITDTTLEITIEVSTITIIPVVALQTNQMIMNSLW